MNTLTNIFKVDEEVQAIDEMTYIWEAAKILSFEGDWSVRVKWTKWSTPRQIIVVPESVRSRVEHWNIRKPKHTERVADKRCRRTQNPFTRNPARLQRNEAITFFDNEREGVVTGVVHINDQFLREITVQMPGDEGTLMRYVQYEMLRDPIKEEPTSAERSRREQPEEEIGTRIPSESVPLTCVPCINGILIRGDITWYTKREFKVSKLEYCGTRKKAFAVMRCVADEDETVRLPAVTVRLKTEDFMRRAFLYGGPHQHPVNQAFIVFSAVKRAVGLSIRPGNNHSVEIGLATKHTRKFTGYNVGHGWPKFESSIAEGTLGCFHSWDSVLGDDWNILPGCTYGGPDIVIKSMRFEQEALSMSCRQTIQCYITHTTAEIYAHRPRQLSVGSSTQHGTTFQH